MHRPIFDRVAIGTVALSFAPLLLAQSTAVPDVSKAVLLDPIVVTATRADRRRLEAIVADRSAPQKHVWRANIILATADGYGTAEIMRRAGIGRNMQRHRHQPGLFRSVDDLKESIH